MITPQTISRMTTYQVHTVSRTAHQADVTDRVQRAKFVERQALVHEMNRHEVDSAESTVDTSNKLVHRGAKVLVLLDVLSRWYCELCKNDLADPFGMLREEELEGVKFLRNTFYVVEPVDADNDLDIAKPVLKLFDALLHAFFLQIL